MERENYSWGKTITTVTGLCLGFYLYLVLGRLLWRGPVFQNIIQIGEGAHNSRVELSDGKLAKGILSKI